MNLRLMLAGDRRLVFARAIPVSPAASERADSAVERGVLAPPEPAVARPGAAGARRCFADAPGTSLRLEGFVDAPGRAANRRVEVWVVR